MIKIGIIGFGYWGPNYARIINKEPRVKLQAVSDTVPSNLKSALTYSKSVRVYKNYKELLKSDVDSVIVAVQTSRHFKIVKDCLNAKKNVLCEKPLALKSTECRTLANLAKNRKKVLFVGYTYIYNPAFIKFKKLIKEGKIGDLHYLSLARMNLGPIRADVNSMWDLMPHDVSMLVSILGKPTETFSTGGSYINNLEDIVFSSYKFKDGVIAHSTCSWLAPIKIRNVTAIGSKKMTIFDDVLSKNKVQLFDKGFKIPPRGSSFADFTKAGLKIGKITYPSYGDHVEPLHAQFKNFLKCIKQKKQPLTDGKFATEVTKILEASQRSLDKNQVVRL